MAFDHGIHGFFISWFHSERVAGGHVAQALEVAQEHMSGSFKPKAAALWKPQARGRLLGV